MTDTPMMKCGHAANAKNAKGEPACVICIGIHPGASEIDTAPIDLTGRRARCAYFKHKCQSETDSKRSLAFFEHCPDREFDTYYCGCYGWD